MDTKVVKAKLTKENRLIVSYQEINNGEEPETDEIEKRKYSRIAHQDLVNCYSDLRIHLATICEQYTYSSLQEDKQLLDKFKATHIILGGDDEHEGITMMGQRKLETGMVVNLLAPFTKFNPDNSNYVHAQMLDMTVKSLLSEISQYMAGTKYAPSNQLDLFGGNGTPIKSKRKKKSDDTEITENHMAQIGE